MSDTESENKETIEQVNRPSTAEQDELDQIGGGLYKKEGGTQKRQARLSRRQKGIIGGVAGLLVGGGFAAFSVLQGPLQFIHKAQLLSGFHFSRQDYFNDDRSGKFLLYSLSGKAAKGRLGVLSNKFADNWEARLNEKSGVRSVYDKDTGRFRGYQILDGDKATGLLDELDSDIPRAESMANITDIDGKEVGGPKYFIDLSDDRFKNRRGVVRSATRATGSTKIGSKIGSRLLIKRGGISFHPLTNWTKKRADDYFLAKEEKKRQKADEQRTSQQADFDSSRDPDLDDDPNLPDPDSPRSKTLTRIRSIFNSSKGPFIAVGAICGLKAASSSVDDINKESTAQAMRMGMDGVTMGFQAMSGQDVSLEILDVFNDHHYDEETETSWLDDPYIQQEMGKEPTGKNYNEDFQPGRDKPFFFDVVDDFPVPGIPGSYDACDAFEGASDLINKIPGMSAAQDLANDTIKSVVGVSPDELQEMALDYFSNGGVNLLAEGAERGGIENKGVRLAANDQFIASGGRELSDNEAKATKEVALLEKQNEFNNEGLFARYINVFDSRSLLANAYLEAPKSVPQTVAKVFSLPLNFSSIFSAITPSAQAATELEYSFPLYGFSLDEQINPNYQDPFENADYIESGNRLERLNKEYGEDCFGMTISATGDLEYGESVDFTEIPSKCKRSDAELVRYRFYVADMVNAHSLACYEGEEDSCLQVGFGASSTNGVPVGGVGVAADGFVFPLQTTKSTIVNNPVAQWCHESQSNCHHHYNAADIHVPTGTPVLAARGGTVVRAADNDGSSAGSRVAIKGDDGLLYYYAHMGNGTVTVTKGDVVAAGQQIGRVGTDADAVNTNRHLHFDVLPEAYDTRPTCSSATCAQYPFIDVQPVLTEAYKELPE